MKKCDLVAHNSLVYCYDCTQLFHGMQVGCNFKVKVLSRNDIHSMKVGLHWLPTSEMHG